MFTKKSKNLAIIFFSASLIFIVAKKITNNTSLIFPLKTTLLKNIKNSRSIKTNNHVLTVFVHGTIFNYPSFKILKKTWNDKDNKNGFFKKYVNNMRYTGLYKCQPINEHGLIPINLDETNKKTKNNRLLADLYKGIYQEKIKDENKIFYFYTFGWDGKLDKRKRKEWGFKFYQDLTKEIEKLKKEKNISNLTIEILAHSHGGNVVLYLVPAEEKFKKNLSVNRLILLGTPVQTETKDFVKSQILKKVYNIYSRGDTIQVIDIVSTKSAHSKRRFEDSPNLVQIEVEVNKFQPLHNELWLLGKKTNFVYRKNFPLYPLPLMVFAPTITNFIENKIENPKNLNLKIKTKNNDLKFNFFDSDLIRKNGKNGKSIKLLKKPKQICLLKKFNDLKNINGQKKS